MEKVLKDVGPRYILNGFFLYKKKNPHEYPNRSTTSTHSICIKFDFLEMYGLVDIENM